MLLAGCLDAVVYRQTQAPSEGPQTAAIEEVKQLPGVEKVFFVAEDGFKIVGELYAPTKSTGRAIILLPMLNHGKESWREFAISLQQRAWTVLALDLRGHGESTTRKSGEKISWQQFSEKDFQAMILDTKASAQFLKQKFPEYSNPFVAGASIGANVALSYAAENPGKVAGAVLLSPGLDYRGVSTEKAAGEYGGAVFLAASSEDKYSFESSQQIHAKSPSTNKVFEKLENAGHGTTMLAARPGLAKQIAEWLEANWTAPLISNR